ncbi:MAG: hypothetical protein H6667_19180 [Ardenticatenaceae bacterium]|nr:hypothetical protein [Ardenticatenaceae bacterium]MCB9446160.1 hypothetical protein [Ardenticatenaceae bacterium]
MLRKRNLIVFTLVVLSLLCGAVTWVLDSPTIDDFFFLHDRDTESGLAGAFTLALKLNHPSAYEMINVDLTPRLDEWMNTHTPVKCIRGLHEAWASAGRNQGLKVRYGCFIQNNNAEVWYWIKVDDIIIDSETMKITDWGEVTSEIIK